MKVRSVIFSVLLIYIFFSLSLPLSIYALNTPRAFKYDTRVRHITYNPQDVVQVETVIGIATHIVLEDNENYITHAFGDSEAWAFINKANHYFIKPKEQDADTNLTIITDKRTYYFRLTYHESNDSKAMYGIKFIYPGSNARQRKDNIQKQKLEQGFLGRRGIYNLSYTMSGDIDIAPINVWDNGEFTYFKFAGNVDIPGIYMVDTQKQESIANRNVIGQANDIIVVHKINHKWILRLGNRALAIFNEDYDPALVTNDTGTVSPTVKRIIKEGR